MNAKTRFTKRLPAPAMKHSLTKALVFIGVFLPVLILVVFSYVRTKSDLTEREFVRRRSIAELTGRVVQERFDGLIELGESFALRFQFRKEIENGDWDAAARILEQVARDLPYIGGKLWFESRLDAGSTFYLKVPRFPGTKI